MRKLALALALLAGCSSQPAPPDLDAGTGLLKEVLQAWKDGAGHESLASRSPPVVVADPAWTAGQKLAKFEVEEGAKQSGHDVRCVAKLWLDGADSPVTVAYSVSLSPKRVVVRDPFGG
ncbi:MAG: hypothetical protein K2W96_16960 [Gemmataceae bacterium]|nr:hypothetical protein [Gemmataceae bacterium]